MQDALIGHTGFVGQTLSRQHHFASRFNSANIHSATDQDYATVVCAAAPGSMFEANRFPDRDAQAIDGLINRLSGVRARRFVLISTIAVLDRFDGQATETTTAFQTGVAYGVNRRRLETFCVAHFADCLIVRLPALFGPGLRKNFLFDLLNPVPSMLPATRYDALIAVLPQPLQALAVAVFVHDPALGMYVLDRPALNQSTLRPALERCVTAAGFSALGFTHPESRFQFYDMTRLWADVQVAQAAGLSVIHLAPEPLVAGAVHQALTGGPMPASEARLHHEDMRSAHTGLWSRSGPYLMDKADCLTRLRRFYAEATA